MCRKAQSDVKKNGTEYIKPVRPDAALHDQHRKKVRNLICAGVILTLIPMLAIFIACQKQIYSGLAAGSVKG